MNDESLLSKQKVYFENTEDYIDILKVLKSLRIRKALKKK